MSSNLNEGTKPGMLVCTDAKITFDLHIAENVNTANMVLGIIRNSFLHLDKEYFMRLYKAMVRPHLEYANQVWAPRYQRQIGALEMFREELTLVAIQSVVRVPLGRHFVFFGTLRHKFCS